MSIGELFTYHITVPSTPQPTALNDVRIIDDLAASAADISFVSVARIDGVLPWTPVNIGDAKKLVIEDVGNGIDIPADSQAIIEITVSLDNTSNNVNGLIFSNTADYTFNLVNDDPATETSGLPGTSGDITISGPDTMKLMKSGPQPCDLGCPRRSPSTSRTPAMQWLGISRLRINCLTRPREECVTVSPLISQPKFLRTMESQPCHRSLSMAAIIRSVLPALQPAR